MRAPARPRRRAVLRPLARDEPATGDAAASAATRPEGSAGVRRLLDEVGASGLENALRLVEADRRSLSEESR